MFFRYNKAHYDRDNPPPKVVSGYKVRYLVLGGRRHPSCATCLPFAANQLCVPNFTSLLRTPLDLQFNIFYPDLVGSEAPTYRLEKDPNSTKENPMAVIRFSAPKPYQDIGFRIIDKPWDRKRTRIVFDRGILQYVS